MARMRQHLEETTGLVVLKWEMEMEIRGNPYTWTIQDRMISLLEEQARTQRIVCQYLMEQKHGKVAPTFGGNNGGSGSQGENGNQEESIHMGHTGNIPSQSQVASKATPRPYFPTFRTSQPREYNPLS